MAANIATTTTTATAARTATARTQTEQVQTKQPEQVKEINIENRCMANCRDAFNSCLVIGEYSWMKEAHTHTGTLTHCNRHSHSHSLICITHAANLKYIRLPRARVCVCVSASNICICASMHRCNLITFHQQTQYASVSTRWGTLNSRVATGN